MGMARGMMTFLLWTSPFYLFFAGHRLIRIGCGHLYFAGVVIEGKMLIRGALRVESRVSENRPAGRVFSPVAPAGASRISQSENK